MEKILIVDDNTVNRKVLHKILNDFCEVIEATSGEEALEALSKNGEEIIAVLLDIVMPGMDGFEVLKRIRNNPKFMGLPVIIQTENTEQTFEMNALKAGATDFVSKPYNADIIRSRLQNVINTRIMLNEINVLGSDELTGLMSVNQFYFEGSKWIEQNPDTDFDVVALDVVRFGIINESKGVEGGNQILHAIADRIRGMQDKHSFLASRVYADRFVILAKRREGYLDEIIAEADKLTADFSPAISVHMKMGVFEITDKNEKLPIVCGRAFSATNLLKDVYGNKYAYYDAKLHEQIVFEEHINDEMEYALDEKQFKVFYQPKYELFTGGIAGAEALVRWMHPVDGVIPPGQFIPLFEKNGFIVKLDQYVWDCTAEKIASWYREGKKIVPVSVNISRVDIETIDVVKVLNNIVKKHQISPELLHLEITESAYMQDTDKIIRVVTELKNGGFIIEMDDFGSGYSSLNMLAKLPINILKLDMKFIQELETSANARTIIEYTVGLAKWMNLPVVAEGVETDEQLALLKKLECNYVQGYIFAKPMQEEQFEILLKSSKLKNANDKDQELFIYENHQKHKMLIVEDLEMNRSIMRSYFEENFAVVEAANGRAGIQYLEEHHDVDIILLDIYMPEMDGYEVLKKIEENPKLKEIPVLVISAGTNQEREKAMELGADAFIAKPFTAEDIINKIRILLHADSILDDMSIWDMKDMVNNAWLTHSYDDISILHLETEKQVIIKGEELMDIDEDIYDIFPKNLLARCKEKLDNNGKRYVAVKYRGYVLNARGIIYKGNHYLICFRTSLEDADEME